MEMEFYQIIHWNILHKVYFLFEKKFLESINYFT